MSARVRKLNMNYDNIIRTPDEIRPPSRLWQQIIHCSYTEPVISDARRLRAILAAPDIARIVLCSLVLERLPLGVGARHGQTPAPSRPLQAPGLRRIG